MTNSQSIPAAAGSVTKGAVVNSEKTVAIVQSSYIPWRGYFDLINSADEFILLDDVQYTRRDWRNRNVIKTPNGLSWLTIPVQVKGRYNQTIRETKVSDCNWNRRHWKTIAQNYAKAEGFAHYRQRLEELYLGTNEIYLSLINYKFLKTLCELLRIPTGISWSHDYELSGDKTERLLKLCKQVGATQYLSGPSASAYLDEELFRQEGVSVLYMDYSGYPEYNQLYPPFEARVSILDLLLNEGPRAAQFMKSY